MPDTLIDNAGGKYALVGGVLQKAGTLTAGTDTVIIERDYGNGYKRTKSFAIVVTSAVTDSTGQGAGPNLFTQPNAFDHTDWQKSSLTVVANVDGDWDKVYPASTGNYRYLRQNKTLQASTPYTITLDVQADGMNWFVMDLGAPFGYATAWFNLATGQVGNISAGTGLVVETPINLGSGKWRFILKKTTGTSGLTEWMYFYPVDANGSTTATVNGTNGIKIRNAYVGLT